MEIIDGLPNSDYHAHPALGSTSLKTLVTKSPAHYKYAQAHPVHSDAFDLGTAAHALILEGDNSGIVAVDADSWRTKAAQEARDEARAAGKVPLLSKDYAVAEAMRDAVMAHPLAAQAFTGHKAETSIFWEEDGLELKCRPDAWHPELGLIVDLKTTVDANPRHWGKTVANLGYHQSQAHYVDGVKAVTGEDQVFLFVAVEKGAPHLTSVVELDPEAVQVGRELNEKAKRIYRECVASDRWPGYPEKTRVTLPRYASIESEEIIND